MHSQVQIINVQTAAFGWLNHARRRIVLAFLTLLVGTGFAQAAPQFLLDGPQRIKRGELLELVVKVTEDVDALDAVLTSKEGQAHLKSERWARVKAMRPYRIKTRLKEGDHHLTLSLKARYGQSVSTIAFPLRVSVVGPFRVELNTKGMSAEAGRLALRAHTPLGSAKLEVFDRQGAAMEVRSFDFGKGGKSGLIELDFDPISKNQVFRMQVEVSDLAGQWKRFNFVQWFAEIPHEDVVFDSAKWHIIPAEKGKLDAAIQTLTKEVDAFRKTVGRSDVEFDVMLYIGGMTDTVGTKADNQKLSFKRARAIGRYFRGQGLTMPMRIAGFGESALKVPTPDETPEASNRRAIYVLTSGTAPAIVPPSGRWEEL